MKHDEIQKTLNEIESEQVQSKQNVIKKFRDAIAKLEEKLKVPIIYNKFDVNQCEIFGYFFLT
jgi:hypothetical protein